MPMLVYFSPPETLLNKFAPQKAKKEQVWFTNLDHQQKHNPPVMIWNIWKMQGLQNKNIDIKLTQIIQFEIQINKRII